METIIDTLFCKECGTPMGKYKPQELNVMENHLVVICKVCSFITRVKIDSDGFIVQEGKE